MLPPDYLAGITDDILPVFEAYQTSLVNDMARRIARMGVSDASVWQMMRYQEAGGVYADALGHLAALTGQSEAVLGRLFEEAGATALSYDNRVYRAAGLEPIALSQSTRTLRVLIAGLQKTGRQMQNMTLTTAVTSQQAFIQAVDLAYRQVVDGGMSYTQAIANAVRGFADEGLYVLYPTGARARLDVAVRRCVLTGVNQTCAQVSLANADALGVDLVETTAHMGARDKGVGYVNHMSWQGRVFSRSGTHPQYPHFVTMTGFGSGGGLCGWNCRHSFMPFVEGISTPAYSPEHLRALEEATVRYNGEDVPWYDATQTQRAMERDIRDTKRRLSADTAVRNISGDDPAMLRALDSMFAEDAVKLKRQEAALADFLQQTGLVRQGERVQVAGFGRSEASRAVWANRKAQSPVGPSAPGGNALQRNVASNPRMSEAYAEALGKRYDGMTEAGRRAFERYVPADSVADGAWQKTAHYSPADQKVRMNFADDATNLRGVGATYFHEHGHYIDAAAGRPSLHEGFANALQMDYNGYVQNYMQAHGLRYKRDAYRGISLDFLHGDYHQTSAASDLLEGLSGGKITGGYGHGKAYWKRAGALPIEAFAHFYEAQSSMSRRALLAELFPRASQYFEAILEGIIR